MADDEIKALREEIARLRERVAVLEAARVPAGPSIDWRGGVTIGTPRFLPFGPLAPLPPGTIICKSGAFNG